MELTASEAASRSAIQKLPQYFMESESSLPCSQEPSTGLYPVPDQSIPPYPVSLRTILMLSSHLHLGLPNGLFPSGFLTQILWSTCIYNISL
jgi:hypothetical protein